MKCPPFDYVRAGSVEEVVKVLAEADGEGKILAGGQSLVPVLALRLARPAVLVDINRIPGLDSMRRGGGALEVGALVRHNDLVEQTDHPLLARAARWIGHTAIRARGTAAGSIAHADPAAELPAVAVATGATAVVAGPEGTRSLAPEELFAGPLMTGLRDDEMITGLRFPLASRWGFAEFARRHGDFALVTAAVAEIDGVVRIALGGVGGVPRRAVEAERVIAAGGAALDAAGAASREIDPTGDIHASAAYRRALAAEMVRDALAQAGVGEGIT
ncbi:MAG: FAD binding domain-containing protein [Pseudonocardia sp.]|nr:FAD binding domain-containing protein [Pseudonocardia sp.]